MGHALKFMYSGNPQLPEDPGSGMIDALRALAQRFKMSELVDWCDNLAAGEADGFNPSLLNPSIATFVSDRSGARAGKLFLQRTTTAESLPLPPSSPDKTPLAEDGNNSSAEGGE